VVDGLIDCVKFCQRHTRRPCVA